MRIKLTRRSYKRKIIVFGMLLFVSIALISTGFAAWIISQGSSNETTGNVEVGVVTDKSLDIINLTFDADYNVTYEDNGEGVILPKRNVVTYEQLTDKTNPKAIGFAFQPQYGDYSGNVQFDAADKAEALKIEINGTITTASSLLDMWVLLEVPESMRVAVEKGYIQLPEAATLDVEGKLIGVKIPTDNFGIIDSNNQRTFKYTVEFKWGTFFNGKNPGVYFDSEAELGYTYALDEVKVILNELRGMVLGINPIEDDNDTIENESIITFGDAENQRTYNVYDEETLNDPTLIPGFVAPKFKLTIKANAN